MRTWMVGLTLVVLLAPNALARVWTNDKGEKQVEAEFVSLNDNVVKFRLPSGELRRCDRARLSAEDQAMVVALAVLSKPVAASGDKAPAQVKTQALTSAASGCEPCAPVPSTYECTIMVPQLVTEMRTITVCEWRSEQRQSTYTACRIVPETRQVTYQYTVPTYENRVRELVYSVMKPVLSTVQREYTVLVPHTETRQGTRRACQMVPVEMTRTVCEDHGCWQQVVRQLGCGCCGPCEQVCNIWVPNLEQREVTYTVMRPQAYDVPYEYNVTVCRPETRTKSIQVCNYVAEQQTRSVPYTVCVPVTKTGTRNVTNYRRVEEQKIHTYTVRVPYPVQKQVPVQVCRMVAKKVMMQTPSCGPAPGWCENSGWCNNSCW